MTKNRQQLLAFIAIAAIVFLVADRLVVSPLTGAWKDRSARIASLKRSVTQGELLMEREAIIRERWEGMRTNTLTSNMSAAENSLLKAFDRWSQSSRISITSLKPQWKQPEDDYMTLEWGAEGFGNLEALARFLYEMEKDTLALKMESVTISARDREGQQLAFDLRVSGLLLNPQQP